ncbi:hypothetical protein LZK73_13835 [Neorhizobium galegae]|nr:hypothetical protein LZK73_13835 [Neorhizobium galegae]
MSVPVRPVAIAEAAAGWILPSLTAGAIGGDTRRPPFGVARLAGWAEARIVEVVGATGGDIIAGPGAKATSGAMVGDAIAAD